MSQAFAREKSVPLHESVQTSRHDRAVRRAHSQVSLVGARSEKSSARAPLWTRHGVVLADLPVACDPVTLTAYRGAGLAELGVEVHLSTAADCAEPRYIIA